MNKRVPILALQNVTKSYPQGKESLTILKKCQLKIYPGEVVGLLGVSGSGKSTLLHMAGLLDVPTSGEVFIHGTEVQNQSDAVLTRWRNARIGFIYQFHHLLPEFTALENVMMPCLMQGESAARAKEKALYYLNHLGLQARITHFPSELSGGEQQRVAIARAFVNDPSLILADEPTGNLDTETAHIVFDLFLNLAREKGLSCLIATHDRQLASQMDRVFVLDAGRLVEQKP
jgi:lipoprotein-releasing system ATP-binding protein